MQRPKVSVLLSVFNGESFIKAAIESILNQTFQDFEFVIVDDASSDKTLEIIKSFKNTKIRVFQNQNNKGLTKSLNRGLSECSGKYIARLDADDRSYPERLQRQVAFLESHPEIGLVLTGYKTVQENTKKGIPVSPDPDPLYLNWCLLFNNKVRHSTVMFRKEIVDQLDGYDESFQLAQDYDLWSRMVSVTKFGILPDILGEMNEPLTSYSMRYLNTQMEASSAISLKNLKLMSDGKLSDQECKNIHYLLGRGEFPPSEEIQESFRLIPKVLNFYQEKFFLSNQYMKKKILKDCFHRLLNNMQQKYSLKERVPVFKFLLRLSPTMTITECLKKITRTRKLKWTV